jgi:hypothetical protein
MVRISNRTPTLLTGNFAPCFSTSREIPGPLFQAGHKSCQPYRYESISIQFLDAVLFMYSSFIEGVTLWRSWLRHCATSRKVVGSIPDGVTGIFNFHFFFRPHYGSGVDSSSNRNEYQEYFLWGKGGQCVVLTTLPPSCATCLKSGIFSLLEPSGPVKACNGIALLLFIDSFNNTFCKSSKC